MEERRKYHRFMLHTEIEHESISSPSARQSVTKDISRGGVCITTSGEPLQKGSHYRMKFILPFSEMVIAATGQVMWTRQEGNVFDNGIAFIDIEDKFLNQIEEFSIGSVEEKDEIKNS